MEKTIYYQSMEGLTMDRVVRDSEFTMPMKHVHDSYELYVLLEGERYYFIDQETYQVETGMIVLVKRNQIHKTSMAANSYHDRILFQLKGESFDPFLRANGLLSLEELFSLHYGIIKPDPKAWEQILQILGQIQYELEKRQDRYQVMVKLKVCELMLYLSRYRKRASFNPEGQKVQTPKHQKVHEVADYLLNHCETGESLEEMGARFYVSKSYLCRIFKEVTGFTVNEYLNMSRIQKAQKLLKNSSYSITEISGILGFESLTYFERVFKKLTDTTPYQYRKTVDKTL